MMRSAAPGAKARPPRSPQAHLAECLLSGSIPREARMAVRDFGRRYYPSHVLEPTVKAKPGDDPARPPKRWRPGTGIYVIARLQPSLATLIGDVQARFDPKLARIMPPHITLIGSSGAGPIDPSTPVPALRAALEPIANTTPPLTLDLGAPMRFMQTDIIVLPLNPHGPLRELHERIVRTGLKHAPPRFAFTPHITLSFYRELTPDERRAVLAVRVTEPAWLTEIECSLSNDPQPARELLRLPLQGTTTPSLR